MARFVIIELSENEAKIVQASKSRKNPLSIEQAISVGMSDLSKDDEGLILRSVRIKEALKNAGIQGVGLGLIIPKQNTILRTAILPSSDEFELFDMALFEAEKAIPFNADRHIISNSILRLDNVEGSSVLISAVDMPVMEEYMIMINDLGIEPLIAEVSPVSLFRVFATQQDATATESSVVLLNIGKSQTELTIIHDGIIAASRSTSFGIDKLAKDIQKAMHLERELSLIELKKLNILTPDEFIVEDGIVIESPEQNGTTEVGNKTRAWIQRLERFISQSFDFAIREYEVPAASAIYLSGEASLLHGLSQSLSVSLHVDVLEFDPLDQIEHSPSINQNPYLRKGLAAAVGAAIRLSEELDDPKQKEGRINLLPPEVIEQQEASEKKILLMISATMVIITLVLIFLAYDTQARHTKVLLNRYTSYNELMKDDVEGLEKKQEQLEILQEIRSDRVGAIEILDLISEFEGLGSTLNGGVITLTQFKYSVRGEVTIGGTVTQFEEMQRFADFLEHLSYDGRLVFDNVGLPKPTPFDLSKKRGTVYAFSIESKLNIITENRRED
jgi:type IV pilus assembly protein PilM